MSTRSFGVVISAAVVASCGGDLAAPRGEASQSIVGGGPAPDDVVGAVLVVWSDGAGFYPCAGVLVAENLVLTTRSCVAETVKGSYSCLPSGEPDDNEFGAGYVLRDHPPDSLRIYAGRDLPSYADDAPDAYGLGIVTDGAQVLCSHDLAAVVLDRKLAVDFAQIRLPGQVAVEEAVTVAGWGAAEGKWVTLDLHSVDVAVRRVGPLSAQPGATGTLVPRTFETGPAMCLGDTGAPAYASSRAVVGIGSMTRDLGPPDADPSKPCAPSTVTSVFMQVAGFQSLLDEAFALAGTEPWMEGGPDPRLAEFGEACNVDADCQSSICLLDQGGAGSCNMACSDAVPCPAGDFVCREADGGDSACLAPVTEPDPDPVGAPAPDDDVEASSKCSFGAPPSRSALVWTPVLLACAVAFARRRRH